MTEADDNVDPGSRSSKPRLVILATTFPVEPGDGTPEFVLTLAESLQRWDVTVVAPRVPGSTGRSWFGDVQVVRTPYLPGRFESIAGDAILPALRANPWRILEVPFLLAGFCIGAVREIRREPTPVVNAHWILPSGAMGFLARRALRVPYVLTVHGADAYALNGRLFGCLKRAIMRNADSIAPVSVDIARTLGIDGSPVLPMGVDTQGIRSAVGVRAPEDDLVVMIGRLADKKGFDNAIRALAHTPRLRMELIGSGPEEGYLRQLAESLRLEDRVRFRGRQPRSEVLAALRRARVVLIPSKVGAGGDMEGTPVVLCESMAAGVPVVASDLGGLGEHIESGVSGLLVPPGDVGALVLTLQRIGRDEVDLERLGEQAALYASEKLDIGTIARCYDRLLLTARESSTR